MPPLPEALASKLAEALQGVTPKALAQAAERLSRTYREGGTFSFRTEEECLAYAAVRFPATYAAVRKALAEVKHKPQSFLDLGAGPGTAAWAAIEVFGELERVTLVERDSGLAALGRRLGTPCTKWMVRDLREMVDLPGHDLVVLSYSLGELPEGERTSLVERAWASAGQTLVIVEPGTTAGFGNVRAARKRLIELGGTVGAPCPHSGPCPIAAPDWCHFAVRVQRTKEHRNAKQGELGYEDEKYSYVVVSKREATAAPARIVRHPQVRKGLIELRLCTGVGLRDHKVSKKDDAWRAARKARWGDSWAV